MYERKGEFTKTICVLGSGKGKVAVAGKDSSSPGAAIGPAGQRHGPWNHARTIRSPHQTRATGAPQPRVRAAKPTPRCCFRDVVGPGPEARDSPRPDSLSPVSRRNPDT